MKDLVFLNTLIEERKALDEMGKTIDNSDVDAATWIIRLNNYLNLKREYEKDMKALRRSRKLCGLKTVEDMQRYIDDNLFVKEGEEEPKKTKTKTVWGIFTGDNEFPLVKGYFRTRGEAEWWLSHSVGERLCEVREVKTHD